jgi:hypothetical protein
MHVLLTKAQFDEFKKKAGEAKMKIKEDDDQHGVIETEDANVNYFYNPSEGRLSFGPSKRKTLAAYCASDNILGTFIMDKVSEVASKKEGESGEGQEKKAA